MHTHHFPEMIMRTGVISTVSPLTIRRPISPDQVEATTRIPVGRELQSQVPRQPVPAAIAPPPPMEAEQAMQGVYLGSDNSGRPVREFRVSGAPSGREARAVGAALKQAASILRKTGLENATPDLIGGPLASLARGEAIVLRWPNGAGITAAL